MKSAAACGLIACHGCGNLSPLTVAVAIGNRCTLCHSRLHQRKPFSVQRSWAWLVAGMLVYLPANIYPVMYTSVFGAADPNTIISGVLLLIEMKSYPVALLVFVASVVVPLLKFLAIGWLLISIQRRLAKNRRDRTRLYRITEFVGRWSMVDVFVVAILAALVQLGGFAVIDPGVGVVAFGATVIFTMLSALSLDSRLIWD